MESRLQSLDPVLICADEIMVSRLKAWKDRIFDEHALPEREGTAHHRISHGYATEEPVFRLFGRVSGCDASPVDVTSDTAYLGALRDGIVAMQLRPGRTYSAPAFHPLDAQPFMLLAGLLCGATYVHATLKQIENRVFRPRAHPVDVFGVHWRVRNLLLEQGQSLSECCKAWFKNPGESLDYGTWQIFVRNLGLSSASGFNLRWDPAVGGCVLISARKKGLAHPTVMPPPGSAWALDGEAWVPEDYTKSGGDLAISLPGGPVEDLIDTRAAIDAVGAEWFYSREIGINRYGIAFPAEEITEFLEVRYKAMKLFFSFVNVPRRDLMGGKDITLIVFSGKRRGTQVTKLQGEIRAWVDREMGVDFQPDAVRTFPVYPRFFEGGAIKHKWSKDQFLSGGLTRRSDGELYEWITRTKSLVLPG